MDTRIKKGQHLSQNTEFKKGQHWRTPKPHWQKDWLFNEYIVNKDYPFIIYQTIDGGDHRDALRQSSTFATNFLNIIEKNLKGLLLLYYKIYVDLHLWH